MSALTGLVACGVVIVEGPPGTPEAFTDAERDAAYLAVILAQQQLARMSRVYSPNGFLQCSFVNEYHSAVINPGFISPPTDTTGDHALRDSEVFTREAQWRDLALNAIGISGAGSLVRQYREDYLLRQDWRIPQKPRHAIVIFVTKFPTGWLAYADRTAGKATMQFDWCSDTSGNFLNTGTGGHGLANLDIILAHEIAHLFGALDEYLSAPCNSTDTSGPRPTANLNCGGLDLCLMKSNSPVLCVATVEHLGWLDLDGDGVVDSALPEIDRLSTDVGVPGDLVDFFGAGLGETRSVVFVGVGAADFTIVVDHQLSVVVPEGSGDDVDVYVSTPFGVSVPSASTQFTYSAPVP